MKINLKVRIKNPIFWLTIIPAILSCIYTVLGCFNVVPSISQDTIVNAFTALVTTLSTLGVLVDPTTSGVNDSERALSYTNPQ